MSTLRSIMLTLLFVSSVLNGITYTVSQSNVQFKKHLCVIESVTSIHFSILVTYYSKNFRFVKKHQEKTTIKIKKHHYRYHHIYEIASKIKVSCP